MWRKWNPHKQLVEMEIDVATMEIARRFLKKLKIELPHDPSILLLGIYTKKMKTLIENISESSCSL